MFCKIKPPATEHLLDGLFPPPIPFDYRLPLLWSRSGVRIVADGIEVQVAQFLRDGQGNPVPRKPQDPLAVENHPLLPVIVMGRRLHLTRLLQPHKNIWLRETLAPC